MLFGQKKKKQELEISNGGSVVYRYDEQKKNAFTPPKEYGVCNDEINQHFEKIFPNRKIFVYHEIVSDLVHIDINIMYPTDDEDFYVVFTTGMSDLPMTIPDDIEDKEQLEYAELFIYLPRDWNPGSIGQSVTTMEEKDYWPIRLLKNLARFPHEYKTWLASGHSVPNGPNYEPYIKDSKLSGVVLCQFDNELAGLETPNKTINLYTVAPCSKEEIAYKLEYGMGALIELLDKNDVPMVVDIYRQSVIK